VCAHLYTHNMLTRIGAARFSRTLFSRTSPLLLRNPTETGGGSGGSGSFKQREDALEGWAVKKHEEELLKKYREKLGVPPEPEIPLTPKPPPPPPKSGAKVETQQPSAISQSKEELLERIKQLELQVEELKRQRR